MKTREPEESGRVTPVMRAMPEEVFQLQVIETATMLGWEVWYHGKPRPVRGQRVSYQLRSRKGWPDLTIVKERVIFAELKTETGRLEPEQVFCLDVLAKAGCEVWVWRPRHWDEIVRILGGRPF